MGGGVEDEGWRGRAREGEGGRGGGEGVAGWAGNCAPRCRRPSQCAACRSSRAAPALEVISGGHLGWPRVLSHLVSPSGRLWSSASSQGVRQLAAPRLHHAQVRHRVALVQRAAAQLEEADLFTARGVKRRCSHQPRSFRKLSWRSVSCAAWCVCRCGVAFLFCLSSTPIAPVSESAGRVSNYRSARRCAACRPPSRGSGGRCLR